MFLYFEDNNLFVSKPQNTAQTGFNEWDLMKYKPDRNNYGLLSALGIDNTTEWSYANVVLNVAALSELSASIDANGVYSNLTFAVNESSDDLTETIRIKLGEHCGNPIYIAYVNELGGLSYELFSIRQDEKINIDGGKTVAANFSNLENANVREFTIGANARKSLNCYKENIYISNKDRFLDFKKSIGKRDVLVLNKVFRNSIVSISDYSGTITGTILINSIAHGQESDDQITLPDSLNYTGTYNVIKIDEDNFAVVASYVATETGIIQRIMKQTDWLRCQAIDKSEDINNRDSVFDIEFEILLPTGT